MNNHNEINPWEEIPLSDYENHMRLKSVQQLQPLDKMMRRQFSLCDADTAMILALQEATDWSTLRGVVSSKCSVWT